MIKVVAALGLLMASAAQAVDAYYAEPAYHRGESEDFVTYAYTRPFPKSIPLTKFAIAIVAKEAQQFCRDKPVGTLDHPLTIVVTDPETHVVHKVDRCW
ncbi:hypothetical protein [Aeromonas enteropelogenes]|jgi:hypothetical protein|uniref:hypothetical protein n=1 Tax=Aeromonas enteropelogenes TaxID=29489 RepID=UPI001CBB44F9|nr:hypothetical protein [Aeromonas enteropelogenes]UAK70919.1 hypothetical protein K8O95_14725 [Aeromonas enteropelogenes]